MGKSIARTKKRKFSSNQFTKQKENSVRDDATASVSASKLGSFNTSDREFSSDSLSGNRILDLEILAGIFAELSCPKCNSCKLVLEEDSRYGLCSHFVLKCENCEFVKGFASSKKTVNEAEINKRLVYGMRQVGKGFSAAYKLCSTLNLPQLSHTSYKNHQKKLLKVVADVAENSMSKAAEEVIAKREGDECGVSVDGTWQRRGYTSLNGCVAALSINTGKVLDIEVMSSYCVVCKKLQRMQGIERETLTADHVCQCNFEGSAAKMESVGASRIFRRSLDKRNLKYTEYYGDGDSKGYLSVQHVYGNNSVSKLECIGHIQKRVGTRLRKLKAKTKGLSGRGKLTDAFIDRLQNYYGIAIRANVGNLRSMQQNAIAALFHCASSVKKPMHGQCPLGKDSWCYHQRAVAGGKPTKEKYPGLPNNVLNIIKPTYLELCTKELLEKCLHGKTQNANESFNGIIWQRIPKEVFVSLQTVKLGAYDAVIQFNDGFKGCLKILEGLSIRNPGAFTVKGYKKLDASRICDSKRHGTPIIKRRRKILRAIRKNKTTALKSADGEVYKPGGF